MLKIEPGKFYRTRNGHKVGPMAHSGEEGCFVWREGHKLSGRWNSEGLDGFACEAVNPGDLIAEWSDAPDLTKITTAFGLLDEVYGPGTQVALKAHGGPYEWYLLGVWCDANFFWTEDIIYRVKPAPPKPQERWVFGCWAHEDKSTAREAARMSFSNSKSIPDTEIDAMLTLYREVLPE